MRTVSIGSGSKDALTQELRRMADEIEKDGEAEWNVKANESGQPHLTLRVAAEDHEPDWIEPLVDYSER